MISVFRCYCGMVVPTIDYDIRNASMTYGKEEYDCSSVANKNVKINFYVMIPRLGNSFNSAVVIKKSTI